MLFYFATVIEIAYSQPVSFGDMFNIVYANIRINIEIANLLLKIYA